jgi:hypothetical protein
LTGHTVFDRGKDSPDLSSSTVSSALHSTVTACSSPTDELTDSIDLDFTNIPSSFAPPPNHVVLPQLFGPDTAANSIVLLATTASVPADNHLLPAVRQGHIPTLSMTVDGVDTFVKTAAADSGCSTSAISSNHPLIVGLKNSHPDLIFRIQQHEISGISSAAIAQMLGGVSDVAYDLLNFPEHQYFTNGVKKFNDGGTTDCTGTLALIRRNVTKIIACLACNDAITSPTITDANESPMQLSEPDSPKITVE